MIEQLNFIRVWISVLLLLVTALLTTIAAQENTALLCADGIDNDGDGFIDCDDQQCANLSNNGCITCFGDGLSFADYVLEYAPRCPDNNEMQNPVLALGVSDYLGPGTINNFVSLGEGGVIKLGFENNLLVNSGNSDPDVWIFEIDQAVEAMFVELHPFDNATLSELLASNLMDTDADGYFEFGRVEGSTSSLDLDAVISGFPAAALKFNAIKLIDIEDRDCSGITSGADLDAVCALSSIPLEVCGNEIDDDQDGFIDCDDIDLQDDCCCLFEGKIDLGPDRITCEGDTVLLEVPGGYESYSWNDGDTNRVYRATVSGTYVVSVTDVNDCVMSDEINIQFNADIGQLIIIEKCPEEQVEFNHVYYSEPGIYFDTMQSQNMNCDSIFRIEINDFEPEEGFLVDTMKVCGDEIELNSQYSETTWPDGSVGNNYVTSQEGLLSAIAIDINGCVIRDLVRIEFVRPSDFYVPTAFSPNDDGINDKLYPVFSVGAKNAYLFTVYNRWGQVVYKNSNSAEGWNGTANSKVCDPGVYIWVLEVNLPECGSSGVYRGNTILLR